MLPEDIYRQAYRRLAGAKKVLLITHTHPDGDGLASVCALIEALDGLSIPCAAYCYDEVPRQYDWLPRIESFTFRREKLDFPSYDLIVVVDCGGLNRTMLSAEIKNRRPGQFLIDIDHHPKIDDYADLELRDPSVTSTAEVIYYFFKANHLKIGKTVANCLLTGIMTDTAFFVYPSTSEQAIDIASEMLKRGARLPQIMEYAWHNKSLAAMKVWGAAIGNLVINPRYNLAFSVLTGDETSLNGITAEELEGVAGFLNNLSGVKATLLLREENGHIRGSLRSNYPGLDISRLARLFGGGGHAKAAGFVMEGRLVKTENRWKIE
jgi:bifunctional oligoribonuclease and PAP phosphatase NrnA